MAITDLLLGEIILTAYIPKILNISSFIYSLYFLSKLYHHESNQFNVFFHVNGKHSRIHQFGASLISDAKYWHHIFDFLHKANGSKKL